VRDVDSNPFTAKLLCGVELVLYPVVMRGLDPERIRVHLVDGVDSLLLSVREIPAVEPRDVGLRSSLSQEVVTLRRTRLIDG
jgi:hypothetical protein